MQLELKRFSEEGEPTLGELFIDGKHFAFTLEDTDRGLQQSMTLKEIEKVKVYGETAIPYGTYKVSFSFSPKFKRMLPMIEGVKGFAGVRFHRGNTQNDTLGCILVAYIMEPGDDDDENIILDSRQAEIDLVKMFRNSKDKTHTLIITKEPV